MFPFAGAQDLEEVLPKKVEVSVIDYSDDFEPSITVPPAMDSAIIDDFEAANAALFNQQEDKQQAGDRKGSAKEDNQQADKRKMHPA